MGANAPGEMKWIDVPGERFKVLHLRDQNTKDWTPYDKHIAAYIPVIPDYLAPDGSKYSKGFALSQVLLDMGWVYAQH